MAKRLLILLVLFVLVGFGVVFATTRTQTTLTSLLPHSVATVSTLFETTLAKKTPVLTDQATNLTQKVQEITSQTQQVLGSAIEVAPEDTTTASSRAIEYGQYFYCKQVVTEYERKQQNKPD